MNIFKLVGELVVIYILYKIIFDFIVPLFNATKQMKGKVSEMQERMQQQQQRAQAEQQRNQTTTNNMKITKEPVAKEDYIDYEEVK